MRENKFAYKDPRVGPVCAIGNFDAVHPGHRRLFSICRREAAARGVAVCAITFDGLMKEGGRLLSDADREAYLLEAGATSVVAENFADIREMSPEAYIEEKLLPENSPSAVVCGKDFRFGRGGEGDIHKLLRLLENHGIPLFTADTAYLCGLPISTSRIKAALSAGDVETATHLLGRSYSFAFPVEEGKRLGRKIGFPTANQRFPDCMFVPRFGVYAGRVPVAGVVYPCVTNIGVRPTVDDGSFVTAESHLIGYTGDLYGQTLRVELVAFLRDEMKFSSVDGLAAQIQRDTARVRALFGC